MAIYSTINDTVPTGACIISTTSDTYLTATITDTAASYIDRASHIKNIYSTVPLSTVNDYKGVWSRIGETEYKIGYDPGDVTGSDQTHTSYYIPRYTYGNPVTSITYTPSIDEFQWRYTNAYYGCSDYYPYYGCSDYYPSMNDKETKISKIKANLSIVVKSRAKKFNKLSEAEITAMQTLREMISESDYRKYLKYGFVLVRGKSGDIYQISRGQHHTKVWRNGVLIEEICVYITDTSVPPTDSIIAFINMIWASEEDFKAMGNRYKMAKAA